MQTDKNQYSQHLTVFNMLTDNTISFAQSSHSSIYVF